MIIGALKNKKIKKMFFIEIFEITGNNVKI